MKIYWQRSYKKPECGDLKVMANGDKYIRYFRIHGGMYVVNGSKHCYEWFRYDDDCVKRYRGEIESGKIKFANNQKQGRKIHIKYK